MSKRILIAACALALACTVQAADDKSAAPAKEPSAQQQRMKQCNADAKGKKGDERKSFMKECLSKKA